MKIPRNPFRAQLEAGQDRLYYILYHRDRTICHIEYTTTIHDMDWVLNEYTWDGTLAGLMPRMYQK